MISKNYFREKSKKIDRSGLDLCQNQVFLVRFHYFYKILKFMFYKLQ